MQKPFSLEGFLPYRLHRASEKISNEFRKVYHGRYGMTRSEWRVLAHLGQYGEMTATEIGQRAGLHKTKVSRAVVSLEKRRWLVRSQHDQDHRVWTLALTPIGKEHFAELGRLGVAHNAALAERIGAAEMAQLLNLLELIDQKLPATKT